MLISMWRQPSITTAACWGSNHPDSPHAPGAKRDQAVRRYLRLVFEVAVPFEGADALDRNGRDRYRENEPDEPTEGPTQDVNHSH
jgi:hypothetical protein